MLPDPEVVKHLKQGLIYQQQNRFDLAQAIYQEILFKYPTFADARYLLGTLYLTLNQIDQSIIHLKQAVELSEQATYWNHLGLAYILKEQLQLAENALGKALSINPDFAQAHLNSGRLFKLKKQFDIAISHYKSALKISPESYDIYYNLGNLHQLLNQNEMAEQYYSKTIEIKPDCIQALNNLGNLYKLNKQYPKAQKKYQQAIAYHPGYIQARYNLATLYQELEQFELAIDSFQALLTHQPDHTLSYLRSGEIYQALSQLEQAEIYFNKALALQPDSIKSRNNLGNLFLLRGQLEQALEQYKYASEINPQDVETLHNMAYLYQKQRRYSLAKNYYEKVIELDLNHSLAYYNLAIIYSKLGPEEQALNLYQKAIELNPQLTGAYNNAGNLLLLRSAALQAQKVFQRGLLINPLDSTLLVNLSQAFHALGDIEHSLEYLQKSIEVAKSFKERIYAHKNYLWSLLYDPTSSAKEIFFEFKKWGVEVSQRFSVHPPFSNHLDSDRTIRVGYLSPDFRNHSAAFFLKSYLSGNQNSNIEIIGFSQVSSRDEFTDFFQLQCHEWYETKHLNDHQLLTFIREKSIDILVDPGTGYTDDNRMMVFAEKAAPIQVTTHPTTSGLMSMDYRISDFYLDPPEEDNLNSETLLRMPASIQCYSPPEPEISIKTFEKKEVIMASFNQMAKMNQAVIQCWSRILKALPEAKLMLKNRMLKSLDSRNYLLRQFQSFGVEEEQLILQEYSSTRKEHLALYNEVDFALDTFPFNGHTTSTEALWMGVPILTLKGTTHFGRMGEAFMSILNLHEWVAKDIDDYIARALKFSKSIQTFDKEALRESFLTSPLCQAQPYRQSIEGFYRQIWQDYVQKRKRAE